MQLRLCIIADTELDGYLETSATTTSLSSSFILDTLRQDVRLFTKPCTQGISKTGGEHIPEPYGPSMHITKSNELEKFYYIKMGKSHSRDKYILMIRDDHSLY